MPLDRGKALNIFSFILEEFPYSAYMKFRLDFRQ